MSNEKQVDSGRRGLLVATCAAGGVVGVWQRPEPGKYFPAVGAGESGRRAGRGGYLRRQAWRNESGGMARQAGLDPAPHAGNAGQPEEERQSGRRSESDKQSRTRWTRRSTPRTNSARAPSTRKCWSRSASARTWAARPRRALPKARSRTCRTTGKAASSALATVRPSTWPAASSRTSRRRTNLHVPPYMYLSDTKLVIGKDEKGEA
jgi:ubiquinol-cytochrome c reductase iron-sulfur subunit